MHRVTPSDMSGFQHRRIGSDSFDEGKQNRNEGTGMTRHAFEARIDEDEDKESFLKRTLRLFPKSPKDFRTRKISSIFAIALVFVAVFLIYRVISTTAFYVSNFKPADLVFIFAGNPQHDEMDRTNFLLIGTGGGAHDGPDLTDSIIAATYNHTTGIASMLSIPRDLYVSIPGYGSSRINKIYETLKPQIGSERALEVFKTTVEGVVDLDIHYYVKIDFSGFKDVIDVLGGVDIDVKQALVDDFYPNGSNGYETFSIQAGVQHLDGETALKYARSRHSTSDFDRAQRQQQLIVAIKEKALSQKLLTSPAKLMGLWDEFKENLETNMSLTEMIAFARIAKNFDSSRIVSKVLRDTEIVQEGGLLYTPERQYYGGAFVLRPWGENYENIHRFAAYIFEHPEAYLENVRIEIQNSTRVSGLAQKLMDYLITYGFNVVRTGNTPGKVQFASTHFAFSNPEQFPETRAIISAILPKGIESENFQSILPDNAPDLIIVLGDDFPAAGF